MTIPSLISIISIIIWLIPPFKQRQTEYLYFFLILALADPVTYAIYYSVKLLPQILSPVIALLLLSSLLNVKSKKYLPIAAAILLLLFIVLNCSRDFLLTSSSIIHFLILSVIIFQLIKYFYKTQSINLFLVLLIIYESLNLLKFTASVMSYEEGAIEFYLATLSEIVLGVLFSFITINTKNFKLSS